MNPRKQIRVHDAKQLGTRLGIDWTRTDLEQFRRGLEVESEHGSGDPQTNVTNDDMELTAKLALSHLKRIPDYYSRLDRLEAEAEAYWAPRLYAGRRDQFQLPAPVA